MADSTMPAAVPSTPKTRSQLSATFRDSGLGIGDLVLVHSALRLLGPVDGGADTVIDALLDTVGATGTIAVPTHTWQVVNAGQPVFHQSLTPSNVGTLTNVFQQRPAALRSLHPTHSVAAIGPQTRALLEGHERDRTPCPADGVYGRLRSWGGKVLIIGADLSCCTLFHGCEEWAGMSWAVSEQPIQLLSIAADGRTFPIAMRHHIVKTWERYPRLEPRLIASGAMNIVKSGTCPVRMLDAQAASDVVIDVLRTEPGVVLPG